MFATCDPLIDQSPVPMLQVDGNADHTIRCANAHFARLVDDSIDAVLGRPLSDVLLQADGLSGLVDRVIHNGTGEAIFLSRPDQHREGDGNLNCTAWPVVEPAGTTGVMLQFTPPGPGVDEIREANLHLALAGLNADEHAARYEHELRRRDALLGGLAEGIVVLDASGQPTFVNDAARVLANGTDLMTDLEAMLERLRWLDGSFIHPHDLPTRRLLRGERLVDQEYLLVDNGSVRSIVCNGHAIRDPSGEIELAMLTARDVTGLRELQHLRDEYLALISHDLRSPLTLILGHGRLLRRHLEAGSALTHDGLESVEEIVTAARRMNAMIGGLLESSQLESGAAHMDLQSVDLTQLVRAAVHRAGEPDERDRFSITVPDAMPVIVDPEQIERVLSNLLSNAVKYSPPGSRIRVNARYEGNDATVSVTDEGRGVAPEALTLLFQRYQRIAPIHGSEGHGLGLYISRLIVEAHGGRVSADSELGKGSTFTFRVPFAGPPDA